MEITDVKLNYIPAITEPFDENGLAQAVHDEILSFDVTREDGSHQVVPNDPSNAQYWEVKDWFNYQYNATSVKPFDFTFETMPEPEFEETIYPELPEESEEVAEEVEAPAVAEEPETFMPK